MELNNIPPEPEDIRDNIPLVYDPTPPPPSNESTEDIPEWMDNNNDTMIDPLYKFYNTNQISQQDCGKTKDILDLFNVKSFPELDGPIKRISEIHSEFYKFLSMDFNSHNISDEKEIKFHTDKITKCLESIDDLFKSFQEIQQKAFQSEILFNETLEKANNDIHKIQDFLKFIQTIQHKYSDLDTDIMDNSIKDICEKLCDDSLITDIKNDYEKKLYLVKYYLHHFIKKLNHGNVGHICSICLQKPVDTFLNPCGHTGCNDCILNHSARYNNRNMNPCFLCRKEIKSIHKLYLS
jgi:hypothetical protein